MERIFEAIAKLARHEILPIQMLLPILILLAVNIISEISAGMSDYFGETYADLAGQKLYSQINKKIGTLPAIDFENTETLNLINKSYEGAYYVRGMVHTVMDLLTMYLPYIVIYAWYLYRCRPILPVALIMIFAPIAIISRPQSVFTKAYVVIQREHLQDVRSSRFGRCFTYIQKGRYKELQKDGTLLSDTGDIYSVDLKRIWEEFHPNISFPQFKYWYFNKQAAFSAKAKQFIQELQQPKSAETDSKSKGIRIIVLRKIDKARTKVIYTRQTDANELERCSEAWTCGCLNLPAFPFGTPRTPYPLDVADIINQFWKQNGEIATDKFKPCPKYHGMELLLEPDLPITADMHRLTESAMNIGPYLGNLCAKKELYHPIWEKTKDMLALLGNL